MKEWRDNIYFVLVEPAEQGNIGASARAIKNMGFKNIRLVAPRKAISDEARWFARNAEDVLDSAVVYDDVASAIREMSIVVGTTRRKGKKRGLMVPVDAGAGRIAEVAKHNKVAILFGRESRGLLNEEAAECGFMLTIPSSRSQPSLNLSHAVLIVAYELSTSAVKMPAEPGDKKFGLIAKDKLVGHAEIDTFYQRMTSLLKMLDYIPRGDRDLEEKIMSNIKRFIGRAGLAEWELNMLYGICSQIEKKLGKH